MYPPAGRTRWTGTSPAFAKKRSGWTNGTGSGTRAAETARIRGATKDGTWERTADAVLPAEEADWEREAGSGDWPTSDTGTGWDDDEWGREPDGGTSWGNESTNAEGSSWGETTASSYGREAGWDDDEWDRVSAGGTGWDDESAHAAGSIQDYDDLMAELLQEEDEERSEEEEARRILAIDAEHRRRETERLGLEQELQQAEVGEPGQLQQEARLLSEERERLEQEKESLRKEREYQARLVAERQSVRMAEEQARQASEAREQRKKTLTDLANTIVTGVARIQAVKSGIDPSSIPDPTPSVSPDAWGAVQRGMQIFNQTMGSSGGSGTSTGSGQQSRNCVIKAPPGSRLPDLRLC